MHKMRAYLRYRTCVTTEKPQGRTAKFRILATLFTQSHSLLLFLETLSKHGQWFK